MSESVNFERILAFHTAPTLMGIKCGSLISVNQSDCPADEYKYAFENRLKSKGLKMKKLCECRNRVLIYVYSEKMLKARLAESDTAEFLFSYGYEPNMTLNRKLSILSKRISCDSFPHEIGVFLGYPLDDIRGFIRNNGKNFLLCGYWKVYRNPEQAKLTFQSYHQCRNFLCCKLSQGLNLYQALESYRRNYI